jgi:hypothetical protein
MIPPHRRTSNHLPTSPRVPPAFSPIGRHREGTSAPQPPASCRGRGARPPAPPRPGPAARLSCRAPRHPRARHLPPACVSIGGSLPSEELPLAAGAAGTLGGRAGAAARAAGALYRFTRPHTMLGTAISVTSVSLLALGPEGMTAAAGAALAQALSSALLMNVCIVGINQVCTHPAAMPRFHPCRAAASRAARSNLGIPPPARRSPRSCPPPPPSSSPPHTLPLPSPRCRSTTWRSMP